MNMNENNDKVQFNIGKFQSMHLAQLIYKATDCYTSRQIVQWYSTLTAIEGKISHKLDKESMNKLKQCKKIIDSYFSLWRYSNNFVDVNEVTRNNYNITTKVTPVITIYQKYIYKALEGLGYENPVKENLNGLFD